MTNDEILQAVSANEELKNLLPDTGEIAKRLSVGLVEYRETFIGEGTFMEIIGDQKAADLLDSFDELAKTNNVLRRGLKLLYSANLNLALPSVRNMLDALLEPEDSAKLKALAEHPVEVSEYDVRCALLNDNGFWRV